MSVKKITYSPARMFDRPCRAPTGYVYVLHTTIISDPITNERWAVGAVSGGEDIIRLKNRLYQKRMNQAN